MFMWQTVKKGRICLIVARSMATELFTYSQNDFVANASWDAFNKHRNLSQFDIGITKKWDDAMKNGHFRYTLNNVKTRVVPGKYGYILQLNCQRAVERRSPQAIESLQTPFDGSRFNFSRVKSEEVLCQLRYKSSNGVATAAGASDVAEGVVNGKHSVLINVSPLEYGHILLVPNIDRGLPQLLTEASIRLSIDLLLLSAHPGWRVGFNSLCALASVNHLHLHAWYLEQRLFIETAPVRKLCKDVYVFEDFPSKGFVFQLHSMTVNTMARLIYRVAELLVSRNIAYNFFLTRGAALEDSNEPRPTVRAVLFPRKSVFGKKPDTPETVEVFNIAVCELAGHLPTYIASMFDEITEEFIIDRIRQQMFSDDYFALLADEVRRLSLINGDVAKTADNTATH